MSEKAINDGQWNPWRLLQDAEFIIRDLSPDHDFPGRIRTAREAHDKAIASGTDPETAAEERGRRRGLEEERKRAESVIHVMQQCIRGKCDCTYDGAATQFACEETARKMIDSWDANRVRET